MEITEVEEGRDIAVFAAIRESVADGAAVMWVRDGFIGDASSDVVLNARMEAA
jgi:hypothetical protein